MCTKKTCNNQIIPLCCLFSIRVFLSFVAKILAKQRNEYVPAGLLRRLIQMTVTYMLQMHSDVCVCTNDRPVASNSPRWAETTSEHPQGPSNTTLRQLTSVNSGIKSCFDPFFCIFTCLIHELGVLGTDTGLPFCRDPPGSFSAPNGVFAGKTNTHTHLRCHREASLWFSNFSTTISGWNLFLCSGEEHSAHGDGRGEWPQPTASRTLSPAIVCTRKLVSDPYQHPSITRHKAGAKSEEITAAGAAAYCDDEGAISTPDTTPNCRFAKQQCFQTLPWIDLNSVQNPGWLMMSSWITLPWGYSCNDRRGNPCEQEIPIRSRKI